MCGFCCCCSFFPVVTVVVLCCCCCFVCLFFVFLFVCFVLVVVVFFLGGGLGVGGVVGNVKIECYTHVGNITVAGIATFVRNPKGIGMLRLQGVFNLYGMLRL